MALTPKWRPIQLFSTLPIAGVRNWFPFVGIFSLIFSRESHDISFIWLLLSDVQILFMDRRREPDRSVLTWGWLRIRCQLPPSSDNNCAPEKITGCVIFLFDRSRWRLGSGNVTRRPAPPLNERLLVYVRIYLICIPLDRSSSVIHLSCLLNLNLKLSNKLLPIHRWRQSACLMNGTEWRTTTDLLIRLLNFFCVRCSTSCRCCYLAGWMRLLTAHQRAEEQKKRKRETSEVCAADGLEGWPSPC